MYSMVNVGVAPRSPDAEGYSMAVVGVAPRSREAESYSMANVGLTKPPTIDVLRPQMGWGEPLLPEARIVLTPTAAPAVAYNYLGDVI